MFNKLLTALGFTKESRAYGALTLMGLDQPIWTPRDYEQLTKASYLANADVYACVNLIARSAKSVPFLVTKGKGGSSMSASHPLVKLLTKPNERDTGADFKEAAIAYLLLSGNEYIERSGGTETTPPAFLYAHRPDRFKVIKGNRRLIVSGYQYTAGGTPVHFQPWEILHLRLFNPLDDYYGMSPVEAAAYNIDNANESASLYKRLLQKGYPPGAVTVRGVNYTDQQLADLKAGLRMAQERGDVLLLQDAEWKEMGFKPVDASIFQGRLFTKRDIAAVFGVPSGMIGDTQVKTYANAREERRSLYTEAVIPALTKLCEGLTTWLSPLYPDTPYVDIDKDAIDALAEDRETQAKRVSVLFTTDVIKRSEAREELKYDSIPEDEDGYYTDLVAKGQGNPVPDPNQNPANDGNAPLDIPNKPGNRVVPINAVRRADPGLEWRLKSFNLLSEEQRDNHWKAVEDRRDLWYSRVAAGAEERFRRESESVIKQYRDYGETAAIRAVTRQEDEWHKFYKSNVMAVAEDFGRHTLQSIKFEGYDHEAKFTPDIFNTTILKWLETEAVKRIVGILDVTKDKIRKELAVGVAAGESIYQLSKRLQSMYSEFSDVRADSIARTEVINASNMGSHIAAKATNLPLKKSWIATADHRTRDPHAAANGQEQKMDEPFIVDGYKLMWPGDSSLGAGAETTIRCRCTQSFSVDRG